MLAANSQRVHGWSLRSMHDGYDGPTSVVRLWRDCYIMVARQERQMAVTGATFLSISSELIRRNTVLNQWPFEGRRHSCKVTRWHGIRSLVPHLIGPPSHWSPSHWSPNSLVPQYIIGAHWSPISLVPHITGPHLIGPPFHSSPHHRPIPMVPHLFGPPSHWFPISLVPQLISLPSHWSPNWHPCITHSIGPPSHWSPRLIGPPSHWSPNSLVPFSLVPQFISPQLHIGPPFHSSTQFRPIPMVPHLTDPLSHWSPNWHPHTAHSIGPPSHWSPIALVPSHRLGPQFKSPPHCLNSLVPHLIGPPTLPFTPCSHWSPISLVPHYSPFYPVLIGPPSHWSPNVTLYALFSLVPHLIGPPTLPFMPCSHWSPISLVPQCNPGYTVLIGPPSHWYPICHLLYPVLIGPPSHWSPNVTLSTLFSLVPHLICPPMQPWLYSSHWSPISLLPQSNPVYPVVLIGPPSHWSPNVTLSTLFSLVPHLIGPPMQPWLYSSHWSPISLVPQSNPVYPVVLIGPPSHCPPPPLVTFPTLLSLVPHLIGPPM